MADQEVTPDPRAMFRTGVKRCDPSDPTWLGITRAIIGRPITDEVADWLLWEATSFPLGEPAEVLRQLNELAAQLEGARDTRA